VFGARPKVKARSAPEFAKAAVSAAK